MTPRTTVQCLLLVALLSPVALAVDDNSENEAFWKGVFEENRVLEIHFTLTPEAAKNLEPAGGGRRGGPPGGPPGFGRPPQGFGRPPQGFGRPPQGSGRPPQGFGRPPQGGPPQGFGDPPQSGPPGQGPQSSSEFKYVRATMEVAGLRLQDIGLRHKGNSSFWASSGQLKRPMKIDTNRFVKGQKLFGRTKLNFSNAFKDASFLKEKLGYEVFQAAGFKTPGVGWARVTLSVPGLYDRKVVGLYVIVEQVDEKFLSREYGVESAASVLMKPERMFDWSYLGDDASKYDAYQIKEGKNNKKLILRFAELMKLIDQGSQAEFKDRIGQQLDLDLFASFLAANSLLGNLDSYVATPHNYYLLTDSKDGMVRVLPWDLNETFGTFPMAGDATSQAKWDIYHPWVADKKLLNKLFALESFRSLYLAKVRELLDGYYSREHMFARIDQLSETLKPWVAKEPNSGAAAAFNQTIGGGSRPKKTRSSFDFFGFSGRGQSSSLPIKTFIEMRITSVQRQLDGKEKGVTLRASRHGPPGMRGGNGGPPDGNSNRRR